MMFGLTIIAVALVAVTQAINLHSLVRIETIFECSKENRTNNSNAKCLKHCTILKSKFIKENGEPILDKAPKNNNITDIIQTCAKQNTETDKCERVNKISVCVHKKLEVLREIFSGECAKETNTNVTSYKALAQYPIFNVKDAKLHCYYRCMLMKFNAMDAEGNVDIITLKNFLAGSIHERVIGQLETCFKENNQKDVCSKAAQRLICIAKQNTNYFLNLFQ